MSSLLRYTNFTSRFNGNARLNFSTLGYASSKDLFEKFEDAFHEDIKAGRISLSLANVDTKIALAIKGALLWDNVPVTNVILYFNEVDNLTEITSSVLSFYKINSFADFNKISPSLSSFPDALKEEVRYPDKSFSSFVKLHYINAEKRFYINKKNTVLMTLSIITDFTSFVSNKFSSKNAPTGKTAPIYEGLPVFIKNDKDDETPYTLTGISSYSLDYEYLVNEENRIWRFVSPAFLLAKNEFFAIDYLELIPPNEVDDGWEIIKIKLARNDLEFVAASSFVDELFNSVFNKAKFQKYHNISIESDNVIMLLSLD